MILRNKDESQLDFIFRLIKGKADGIYNLSYDELLESGFNLKLSSDEARKRFYGLKMLLPYLEDSNYNPEKLLDYTTDKVLQADEQKEWQRIRDERNLNEDIKRKITRLEHYETLIKEQVEKLCHRKPFIMPTPIDGLILNKAGVLQLSDWHYGLEINNAWNNYNSKVFERRISNITHRIAKYLQKENLPKLYILVQGDLISSNIRSVIRLKNQEDIIDQIINTSECIAETSNLLSQFAEIEIILVGGNHDRVTPKKDDSLAQENYIRITKWHLQTRLKGNPNVKIVDNEFGYDIGTFQIFGLNAGVIHGHEDNFANVVDKLSTFTRRTYDVIFTSHRHHTQYQDSQKCRVIANSSLCGTDDYSEHLRACAYAGQNFSIIYDNKEVHLLPIITS